MASVSFHKLILEKVQAEIKALGLDGLDAANVVIQSVPDDKASTWPRSNQQPQFPGISVTPLGQETLGQGTNTADDIGYPVAIFVVEKAESQTDLLDRWLGWRELLFDHFTQTRLGDITGVVQTITTASFGTILDPAAWQARRLKVGRINLSVGVRKQRRV